MGIFWGGTGAVVVGALSDTVGRGNNVMDTGTYGEEGREKGGLILDYEYVV